MMLALLEPNLTENSMIQIFYNKDSLFRPLCLRVSVVEEFNRLPFSPAGDLPFAVAGGS